MASEIEEKTMWETELEPGPEKTLNIVLRNVHFMLAAWNHCCFRKTAQCKGWIGPNRK